MSLVSLKPTNGLWLSRFRVVFSANIGNVSSKDFYTSCELSAFISRIPNLLTKMVSPVPYFSALASIAILGYITIYVPPSLPNRLFALFTILPIVIVTITTAHNASTYPPMNSFIGGAYGSQFIPEIIDHICLSRLYFDTKDSKNVGRGFLAKIIWTFDIACNKRRLGSSNQVRNLPPFSFRNPHYTPSRNWFLISRSLRFVFSYLLVDFLTSFPAPDAEHLERLGLIERFGIVAGFWVITYTVQNAVYDLGSVIAVGLHLNEVEFWPPRFGSVYESYTVRRFWG